MRQKLTTRIGAIRTIGTLVSVLSLMVCVSSGHAQDEEQAPPALRVAVVDVARVNAEYELLAQKVIETEQWARQQQQYLDSLNAKASFLTEEAFIKVGTGGENLGDTSIDKLSGFSFFHLLTDGHFYPGLKQSSDII